MFPDSSHATAQWIQRHITPSLAIDCGAYTYGQPNIFSAHPDQHRTLVIGRYVSIGREVNIYVGRHGRHPLHTLTTYPLGMAVSADVRKTHKGTGYASVDRTELACNLNVVIGSDVWLGARSTIVAGVKIGHGAVVGTGSIVTRDVPAYTIVAGAPAKVINSRHSAELIVRLLTSKWWELEPDDIWRRLDMVPDPYDMNKILALFEEPHGQ